MNYPTGGYTGHVAIGDVNGDDKVDLAVTNTSKPACVNVFPNISTSGIISFSNKIKYIIESAPYTYAWKFAIGDLDGDQRPDLTTVTHSIAGDSIWSAVSILRNLQCTTAIGIKEISNALGVAISPNPFTSQTTISFNAEVKYTIIKIVDVLGKEVRNINFSGRQLIIEKEELKAGIYFMQIVSENEMIANQKMVIQ